jgi:hypothetical protein
MSTKILFEIKYLIITLVFVFHVHKFPTDLASFNLINEILEALNDRLLVGGIFCDLQKAFDCVDHEILLTKMCQYGIIDKGLKLITSYLQNLHLVVAEGLVSSSNPESSSGGSIATSRVSHAGQVKRVGTRRKEIPRRWELR